jgi:hypothetical protein
MFGLYQSLGAPVDELRLVSELYIPCIRDVSGVLKRQITFANYLSEDRAENDRAGLFTVSERILVWRPGYFSG